MRNLYALKLSAVMTIGGLATLAVIPAKAQQVILTPGGTMFVPMMPSAPTMPDVPTTPNPAVEAESIPTPEAGLPQYDILTPEQVKPGKMIFRGQEIEILSPDDPRIPAAQRSTAPPNAVWVSSEVMTGHGPWVYPQGLAHFLAPPATTTMPTWDGNIRVGTKIPGFMGSGEYVILASDDLRVPANWRDTDLGGAYYWVIDSRALDPALPANLFTPALFTSDSKHFIFNIDAANREEILANIAERRLNQEFLNSQIGIQARREQLKLIVSNPEIYSLNQRTWGQPVKDVLDAQGNVVMSKQSIMEYRSNLAQGELNGYARTAEFNQFDRYERLGFIPDLINELDNQRALPGETEQVQFYRQLITAHNITLDPNATPMSVGFDAIPGSLKSGQFAGAAVSSSVPSPLTVTGPTTPMPIESTTPMPIESTTPMSAATTASIPIAIPPTISPTVDVQGSQNPVVYQFLDSPLSSSRIFPGMR